MRNRRTLVALTSVFLSGLGVLLFWPVPVESTPIGIVLANYLANLFDSSGSQHAEVMRGLETWLNVLLFVPLAMLLYFIFRKQAALWSFAISVSLSITAELVQLFFLNERVSSIIDVFLNSSGAAIGVAVAWIISRFCRSH